MEDDSYFDSIEDILNNLPENFNILEEEVNIDVQKEFYEASKNRKEKPLTERKLKNLEKFLYNPDTTNGRLKSILIDIAFYDSVEAFRTLERYHKVAPKPIYDWATLALQQSRMVIQSSLLGEQQVFISTGLGGKNNKLRYFFIFPYNIHQKVFKTQESILQKELEFFLKKHEGEVEEVDFYDNFATATTLIPLTAPISNIIKDVLDECNQYGNYLGEDVLITNMKKFSREEIADLIKQHDQEEEE